VEKIAKYLIAVRKSLTDLGKNLKDAIIRVSKKHQWSNEEIKDWQMHHAFKIHKTTIEADTSFDDLKDAFENIMDEHRRKQLLEKYHAKDLKDLHDKIQISLKKQKDQIRNEQHAIKQELMRTYDKIDIHEQKDRNEHWSFYVSVDLGTNKLIEYK
jgi:hypothetical protein